MKLNQFMLVIQKLGPIELQLFDNHLITRDTVFPLENYQISSGTNSAKGGQFVQLVKIENYQTCSGTNSAKGGQFVLFLENGHPRGTIVPRSSSKFLLSPPSSSFFLGHENSLTHKTKSCR